MIDFFKKFKCRFRSKMLKHQYIQFPLEKIIIKAQNKKVDTHAGTQFETGLGFVKRPADPQ